MSSIKEYIVTEPPTSDGVQERARVSLAASSAVTRGILDLTITPVQEVPKPEPQELQMRIARPTYRDGTLVTIEGNLLQISGLETDEDARHSVVVRLQDALSEAATASIVLPD